MNTPRWMKRRDLRIEAHQNENTQGQAFGFVALRTDAAYQGWFFTWPREEAEIRTTQERAAVLDSMEPDAESRQDPQVPYTWARQKLERYLHQQFDLRTTRQS